MNMTRAEATRMNAVSPLSMPSPSAIVTGTPFPAASFLYGFYWAGVTGLFHSRFRAVKTWGSEYRAAVRGIRPRNQRLSGGHRANTQTRFEWTGDLGRRIRRVGGRGHGVGPQPARRTDHLSHAHRSG